MMSCSNSQVWNRKRSSFWEMHAFTFLPRVREESVSIKKMEARKQQAWFSVYKSQSEKKDVTC